MATKIATCCYCGARAALRFDRERHELACSNCAAPLREMKALRTGHEGAARGGLVAPSPVRGATAPSSARGTSMAPNGGLAAALGAAALAAASGSRRKKGKRRKSLGRRMFSEVWDAVEDIFD